MIEKFLEIQNGHHPLQAETVRAQRDEICDLRNENFSLKNQIEELMKNSNIGGKNKA